MFLNKDIMTNYCISFAKLGFITASMGYTLLNEQDPKNNVFRILDEITSTLKNIKNLLKNKGFDDYKLELAIFGISAGAHLSLLYAYLIKNEYIPLKFVVNIIGPVTLEPQYYLKIKNKIMPLEEVDLRNIIKAIKENKTEKVNKIIFKDYFLLKLMNIFIGKKYSHKQIKNMMNYDEINKNDKNYKILLNITKYAFPLTYIKKKFNSNIIILWR